MAARSPVRSPATRVDFLPSQWRPLELTGLVFWGNVYTPGNYVLEDTDRVSQLTDLSGNGNHFIAGTTTRPTFSTTSMNNRPGMAFTTGISMVVPALGAADDWDIWIVTDNASTSGSSSYFFDSETGRLVLAAIADATNGISYFDGAWRYTTNRSGGLQIIGWHLNSAPDIRVDGTSIASPAGYTQRAIGGNTRLGSNNSVAAASNLLAGTIISEVIIVKGGTTAEEKLRVEGYAHHAAGRAASLPAGHKYRSTPP